MKQIFHNIRLCMTVVAVLCYAAIGFAQSSTKIHTVERGETIESIAAKYGLTKAQLIELNPDAKDFIYVGMELTIPSSTLSNHSFTADDNSTPQASYQSTIEKKEIPTNNTTEYATPQPGFAPTWAIEFGFLPKEKGFKGFNYTYGLNAGVNYFFMEKYNKLFAGASIGWNSFNYDMSVSENRNRVDQTSESHVVCIPVRVGYSLKTDSEGFGIAPLLGLDFNCIVSSKSKVKTSGPDLGNETLKGKGKKGLALGFRLGAQICIRSIDVGASYILPVNKRMEGLAGDDGYFAINIGMGF